MSLIAFQTGEQKVNKLEDKSKEIFCNAARITKQIKHIY